MRISGRIIDLRKKIKNLNRLSKLTIWLKSQGKRIVFTNGCFDLLHYGHVKYLQDARNKGDVLIVAVNSDTSVRKLKGKSRPVVKENYRIRVLAALESVNYVTVFNETTPIEVIKCLKPDIIVKGADWPKDKIVGSDFVKNLGGKVSTIKFVDGLSTSGLIRKIAKSYNG